VQALVNHSTVGVGETVTYSVEITITGANQHSIGIPTPPFAVNLVLISRAPSRSSRTSFINGNFTQTTTFSWQYRTLEVGNAYLRPTIIGIAGTIYSTSGISITVVAQPQRPGRPQRGRSIFDPFSHLFDDEPEEEVEEFNEGDIFIRATPDKTSPFVNEQVVIDYELFYRPGMQPRNSRQTDSWDAEGFWREELPINASGPLIPESRVVNGVRYNCILIKRISVFPTRNGELVVEPLRITTEVFVQRRPGSGFGSLLLSNYQEVEPTSRPVVMTVQPFPPNAPASYRNAVGRYTMDARLSRTNVVVGEPLELTVRIEGEGNISTLEGPEIDIPGSFETYDPEVSVQRDEANEQIVRGTKTFTYLTIPRANGNFTIPALRFSYLDPATIDYETLFRTLPTIRVTGTMPDTPPDGRLGSGLPVDDIAGLLPPRHWDIFPATPLHRKVWIYVALGLPLIVLTALAAWRRRAMRLETDVAWARGRRAHPLARRHLKEARKLYQQDAYRPFFVELERAVLSFIGNRINIAELGMTRTQWDEVLGHAGADSALRTELRDFLKTCEAARVRPGDSAKRHMTEALQTAEILIARLESSFRTTQ